MFNYNSMLLDAVKSNNQKDIDTALSNGATLTVINIGWTCHGWNALHWTVYNGNLIAVQKILSHNNNDQYVNDQTSAPYWTNGKETALHLVARSKAKLDM